jgi:sec-independent protein translocase protein TatC
VPSEDITPPAPIEATPEQARMSLIEHLQELRTRLIRAFIAIGIGFILAYAIRKSIFRMLTYPMREVSGGKVLLIGTGVAEAFYAEIKVALIAGLFIASPAVFYEIWKFIAPGLYDTERKLARPFVIFATMFFLLGGYFCWAAVFPVGYRFFLDQYSAIGITPMFTINEYLAFTSKLMLAFALTFEMPIFAFFFTKLGVVDHQMLFSYWRYAILAIFIVSAAITPPDMISMFLLAMPLTLLYVISVGVAWMFQIDPEKKAAMTTTKPESTETV